MYIDIVHAYHIINIPMGVLCCFVVDYFMELPDSEVSSTKRQVTPFRIYVRPPSDCTPATLRLAGNGRLDITKLGNFI